MAEENVNIQIGLVSVSEMSFMLSPGKVGDNIHPDAMRVGFSAQIRPDIKNNLFTLIFGIRYELDGEAVLESLYNFVFKVQHLKQYIIFNGDHSVTVNHIMPHFLNVAVGTMRGILLVKTAGTIFSKYPLPMIDINQLNANLSNPR